MEIVFGILAMTFPFGVIAGVVAISNAIKKKRRSAWQRVAASLGLSYGEDRIYGRIDGQPVYLRIEVRGSGKSQQTYTVAASPFTVPLDLGLMLSPQGFLDDAFGGFFGGEDILTGDPELDPKVVVRADEPARVRALLSPQVRQGISSLATSGQFYVADTGVSIERTGGVDNEAWLTWVLKTCARLSKLLEASRAMVPVAAPLAPHSVAWHRFAAENGLQAGDTPLCMWGRLEGETVRAFALRRGKLDFHLQVDVVFSEPLALGLYVRPANTFDAMSRFFGLSSLTKLGDPAFDEAFAVQVADRDRVEAVLDPAARHAIRELNARIGTTTIRDEGLSLQTRWLSRRPEDAMALIRHMRDLGRMLEENARGRDKRIGPYR